MDWPYDTVSGEESGGRVHKRMTGIMENGGCPCRAALLFDVLVSSVLADQDFGYFQIVLLRRGIFGFIRDITFSTQVPSSSNSSRIWRKW